jgi:glycosyltransferase involved in cell wall biosynthesis
MNHLRENNFGIRVLHLVHGLGMGGAEVALFYYIKALGMEDYDHYVYCFGPDGPVRKRIEALGVPVFMGKRDSIKQPIRFVISLFSLVRDLVDFIESKRIQVIQSHSGQANQLAVAIGKLSGLPTFPTVHSTMAFVDKGNRGVLRVYLKKVVDGFIYRMAHRVLVVSQEIKEIAIKTYGLKGNKVLVLKNGIVFEDSLIAPIDLKKELPISKNKLKLIAVGRLVSLKGFDILVRAVAEAVNQGVQDLLVLVAGDGEERVRLEKLIRDLGVGSYVKLLGFRHDVMGIMKASDIFVIPSLYEGLSIAMIEAMACGLPIIASNAPGLRDFIENEQNGLLFPVQDYKAMAKCILKLAEDRNMRVRLSQGARESFEREYDMRRNIEMLGKLFRRYALKT